MLPKTRLASVLVTARRGVVFISMADCWSRSQLLTARATSWIPSSWPRTASASPCEPASTKPCRLRLMLTLTVRGPPRANVSVAAHMTPDEASVRVTAVPTSAQARCSASKYPAREPNSGYSRVQTSSSPSPTFPVSHRFRSPDREARSKPAFGDGGRPGYWDGRTSYSGTGRQYVARSDHPYNRRYGTRSPGGVNSRPQSAACDPGGLP